MSVRLTAVGGATALIEYAGLRLVSDPTFDPPGDQPRGLVKTRGPAIGPDELGAVDAVLLSHDQHPDNLDSSGREFLGRAGVVLTTVAGAERLEVANAVGLEPWQTHELGSLTVTAVPALHGPPGSDPVMGPVIGFVLGGGDAQPLYVSGDNASVDVVRGVVDRLGTVDVAVLFAGRASIPSRFDGADLTLSGANAAEAARLLDARVAIPLHFDGWAHFSEGVDDIRAAFDAAGLGDRLVIAQPGATVAV